MERRTEDSIPGKEPYIDGILGRTPGRPNKYAPAVSARETAAHGLTVDVIQIATPNNTDRETVVHLKAVYPPDES